MSEYVLQNPNVFHSAFRRGQDVFAHNRDGEVIRIISKVYGSNGIPDWVDRWLNNKNLARTNIGTGIETIIER